MCSLYCCLKVGRTFSDLHMLVPRSRGLTLAGQRSRVINSVYNASECTVRCASSLPGLEKKFRLKVGVPLDYDLIYKAPLRLQVALARGVSSVCLSVVCIGYGIYFLLHNVTPYAYMLENSEEFGFLIGFVLMNSAIFFITNRYPIKLYNKSKSYVAVLSGILPTKYSKVSFKEGEIKELPPKGFMPWRVSMFKVHNRPFILIKHYFRKPSDFNYMLSRK